MSVGRQVLVLAQGRGLSRLATLAVLALGFVAVLVADLPGYLTYDSVIQLHDGRTGLYHLWHPPVMAWLLGLSDRVTPGAALFVAGDAALLFGSLGLMVWTRPRVSWVAVVVAAVLAASPLVLIYQGMVWKDVLFANAMVAGFLMLSVGGGRIGVATAAGWVCLVLAALTRQNGLMVLPLCAAAYVWSAAPRLGWRRALGRGTAALVLMAALVWVAGAAFAARRADAEGPADQFRLLQFYDVVGASQRDPTVDVSPLGPEAAGLMPRARAAYTPERVDSLAAVDDLNGLVEQSKAAALATVWRDVLVHHLPAYAAHRATVFGWTLLTPRLDRCRPVSLESMATLF